MYIPGQLTLKHIEMLIFYVRNLLMYSWLDKKSMFELIFIAR